MQIFWLEEKNSRYSSQMKTIFLVDPKDADMARDIELKLLTLPSSSGILFVGVHIVPEETPLFQITVGCDRKFNEITVDSLVRLILLPQSDAGMRMTVQVFRGISRSGLTTVDVA